MNCRICAACSVVWPIALVMIQAGGMLMVASPRYSYSEGLAASAAQFHKVPSGKILKVGRGVDWTERVLRLEDQPAWMTAELVLVSVADELRQPHPVVRASRDDQLRLHMLSETQTRTLRILDAIAKACQARGYGQPTPSVFGGSLHKRRAHRAEYHAVQ